MTSFINESDFFSWCQIPADQLEDHPNAKVPIRILPTQDEVYKVIARLMADEIIVNNENRLPTRWILPCGPTGQYKYFSEIVNNENILLSDVFIFHMDEMLDWQGRPLPTDHRFSYQGAMEKLFYNKINDEFNVPLPQRHFPDVFNIDKISNEIEKIGGIDTMFGGIGYRGHIAYNEPPRSPWYSINSDQFCNSKTRILHLNEDTLIAISQRTVGGCSHAVPPMAITMGMKDLLEAKKIRLICETGPWKRAVIRILLFGPQTVEYPVTFVQNHKDVLVYTDSNTALAPFL